MKLFYLCMIVSFSCFGADSSFEGTSNQRHEKMKKTLSTRREPRNLWDRSYLTGDWGEVRVHLMDKGVTVGMAYVSNLVENIRGGRRKGGAYAGSFGIDANVDIGKHTTLKGLSFYSSIRAWKMGTNLSARAIGNEYPVQQVYGKGRACFNECYLKQQLFDGSLIFKLGRLNGGNDFLQSNLYYQFMNSGLNGNPIAIFLNGPFTSYPNATWGCLVEFRPYFKSVIGKVGAYVAGQSPSKQGHFRQNWSFHSSDGIQLITEWSYEMGQKKGGVGYSGRYRVGCFYYTKNIQEKYLRRMDCGNSGSYFLIDQMVYQPEGPGSPRGLSSFIALLFAPKDRNLFPFFLTTGLVYKGLLSFRVKDVTNLGLAYGRYSRSRYRAKAIPKGVSKSFKQESQDFESVIELNHWFRINQWLTLGPNFQYVIHPKGLKTIKNAWVLGIEMKILL